MSLTTYSLGPADDTDRYDYAEAINLGDWIPVEMDEPCDPAEFWVTDDFDPITDGLEAA